MGSFLRTIRGFVWWTYERGSLHYDVMVTLILAFIFLGPLMIDFKDKPIQRPSHQSRVAVLPYGQEGLVFEVDAAEVTAHDEDAIRAELRGVIEPLAGEVAIKRYERAKAPSGRPIYRVWVEKQ